MNSTKYYIDTKAGLYTVMYEDIPIAMFDNQLEAQLYQQALESGRHVSYKVAKQQEQA